MHHNAHALCRQVICLMQVGGLRPIHLQVGGLRPTYACILWKKIPPMGVLLQKKYPLLGVRLAFHLPAYGLPAKCMEKNTPYGLIFRCLFGTNNTHLCELCVIFGLIAAKPLTIWYFIIRTTPPSAGGVLLIWYKTTPIVLQLVIF